VTANHFLNPALVARSANELNSYEPQIPEVATYTALAGLSASPRSAANLQVAAHKTSFLPSLLYLKIHKLSPAYQEKPHLMKALFV
jgi:hypothetical protein